MQKNVIGTVGIKLIRFTYLKKMIISLIHIIINMNEWNIQIALVSFINFGTNLSILTFALAHLTFSMVEYEGFALQVPEVASGSSNGKFCLP